jgi:hypothetical protein
MLEGLTGVAEDFPDDRPNAQLSRQEVAENVWAITLRLLRNASKDSLDHIAHSLGARTEASHLPSVTKARSKAVRE